MCWVWGPGIAVLWSCQRIDVCDSVRLLYLLTYLQKQKRHTEISQSPVEEYGKYISTEKEHGGWFSSATKWLCAGSSGARVWSRGCGGNQARGRRRYQPAITPRPVRRRSGNQSGGNRRGAAWRQRARDCELVVAHALDRLVARLEELLSAAVQQLLEQLIRKLLDQPPRLRHAAAL